MNVHFICRGNVLRSYIAETYLKSLQIDRVVVNSSGTVADLEDQQELDGYAAATKVLLARHGIAAFAKPHRDQLGSAFISQADVVVCVNQRVYDEAKDLVTLPDTTRIWNIIDIGEGDRIIVDNSRVAYEEIIYKEVTDAVDNLVAELRLNGLV